MTVRGISGVVVPICAVVVAGGTWAAIAAASSSSPATVRACVLTKTNVIVAATSHGHCPQGATRITINKEGPRGSRGASGQAPEVIDGGAP